IIIKRTSLGQCQKLCGRSGAALPKYKVTMDRSNEYGNARFRSEAQRLPGVNCLDKEFDYWEDRLDREYDREHPRSSVISRCRRMIRDINSKLVAIDV
ncbi:hypothetical protein, partial [Lacrimispora sp.]|uniref:hypothetical protein n=1 Tax=Lacrimispora sp. TaxID=2719234 RepID=UPI00289DA895